MKKLTQNTPSLLLFILLTLVTGYIGSKVFFRKEGKTLLNDSNVKSSWNEYTNTLYSIQYPEEMVINEFVYLADGDEHLLTEKNEASESALPFKKCTTVKSENGSFFLAIRIGEKQDSYCTAQPSGGLEYDSLTFLRDKMKELKTDFSQFSITEELYVLVDGTSLIHLDAINKEVGISVFSPYLDYQKNKDIFEKILARYRPITP